MDINKIENFMKIFIFSTILTIIVGIVFMVIPTDFYSWYVREFVDQTMTDKDPLWVARLVSYFGDSAVVGNISAISIPLILYFLNKKGHPDSRGLYVFLLIVAYIGVILSFARSAWVATIIVSLMIILFNFRKYFIKITVLAFFLCLLFVADIFEGFTTDIGYLGSLQDRMSNITNALDERYYQIEYALDIISEHPLGMGLGQSGHKSYDGDKFIGVYDNNYLRIFSELGIVGINLFIAIIFLSKFIIIKDFLQSGLKDRFIFTMGCVLFIYYFQALGTNIFDLHFASYIFWSFLGILAFTAKCNQKLGLAPLRYQWSQ